MSVGLRPSAVLNQRPAAADRVNRYGGTGDTGDGGSTGGSCMNPAVGEQLIIPSGLPRSLEAAITRYGNATFKASVATVLDPNGKLSVTLTYDETPAYIEYSTDRDGSVMGVTITRAAMVQHCRMLTMACNYTEGENMVCVLDFKREVGLWHSVLTSVLNGMHVIYIPYALMKVNPASWMQMITKHRACVAVVKSRDLHWGLLATKDHKDVNLGSLRMLLVADGANPCSKYHCIFAGLRADAICPCASSSEVMTVSVRRPGRGGVNATGRGVLSMQGLSYGVVRVDQENSLTSLTLQDCGQVMPGKKKKIT
nr:unnamed protein product [Callosobruchus analis]